MGLSTTLTLKFNGTEVKKGLQLISNSVKGLGTVGAVAGRTMLAPFVKLMAVLAPLLGFAAIAKIGTDALEAAASMETLQVQFGALLKSENAATDLISKLRKLNVESPLGLEDFTKGAKQLLGVRMSADESADALSKLSNIAMGNADNFDSLVRAFGQVKSAGRLMGQEVLQFVNAGFNPLAEISIKTGESMAVLKKRMEDGKISFQEVSAAITTATSKGGLFNGMNQKIAATTEGKIQKIKDGWNQLLIAFGTPINTSIKPMMDMLANKLESLQVKAKAWGDNLASVIRVVFNSFGNGSFTDLITTGFMAGAAVAGEKIVTSMIYGGTVISNQFRNLLREIEIGGYKATVGANIPEDWNAAEGKAKGFINSDSYMEAFRQVVAKNQTPQVPMKPQASPGSAASAMAAAKYAMDGAGAPILTDILRTLRQTNNFLRPTP